jgi:hypothetical protein
MPTLLKLLLCCITVQVCTLQVVSAQLPQPGEEKGILSFPGKAVSAIDAKYGKLERSFTKSLDKQLKRLEKQADKLYRKMQRKDSSAASQFLAKSQADIQALKNKLTNPGLPAQYLPSLDTLQGVFKLLQDIPGIGNAEKLKTALQKMDGVGKNLYKADEVKHFLKERKAYLKEQLGKLGLTKQLKKLNKQAYYYAQQVNEYRELVNDPEKLEKKALELISRTRGFKEFMERNSMLAGLFPLADGNASFSLLQPGLQTRNQVSSSISQQLGGGPNAQQLVQQNIQQAQNQLDELKNGLNDAVGGSSDDELPDFKPNNQKTKSFLKRLEYGANLQFAKNTSFLPARSDIAMSLGYKLNDKSVVGLGVSYKLGIGSIQRIRLSSEGAGLRSFVDWKLKGSLWISGGYEMNYNPSLNNITLYGRQDIWQSSGLIGISKKMNIHSKWFKVSKLQLLYDFMATQHVPVSQPLLFRLGYSF